MNKENQTVARDIFQGYRQERIFQAIYQSAYAKGYAFICWRDPEAAGFNCIINTSSTPFWCNPEIETMDRGFIFSPYDNQENTRVLFFGADIFLKCQNGGSWSVDNSFDKGSSGLTDAFMESAETLLRDHHSHFTDYYAREPGHSTRQNKKYFTDIIKNAVSEIKSGHFDKVVPARYKISPVPGSMHPIHAFVSVARAYPNSFISLVSAPYTGTWLGASPEVLISIQNNEIFTTAAVAGTQAAKPGKRLSEVSWTQKEIEEQALVSRYIINCFKKIRLREFSELGPKTVKAGNLYHLKSLYTVNMIETGFPQLGSVMLKLLHPTSAVCGMP
ncbi:MAG TPA: chorismate-binding protein, partial [Cyclobacteriaceae bacterium]|nr:chorismate-binding protein [Cyclobacteriaceae bacterium]